MALQWNALAFAYPGAAPMLAGWRWQAQPGLVQLVDGWGVGKTTALQLLADRLQGMGGALLIDGRAPAHWRATGDVFWHEPRKPETMPASTTLVADWAGQLKDQCAHWDDAWLLELQQGLGLAPHWHKPLLALSTGSLRKVVMALGLASGALLVLLDELLSGLDRTATIFVQQALQTAAVRFAQQGRYLVLAHYEPLLAAGAAHGAVQVVELPR